MKEVKIRFYHVSEKEKPHVMDEIIFVGVKDYDVVTYDGEFIPAWVDWWGKLDLSDLK